MKERKRLLEQPVEKGITSDLLQKLFLYMNNKLESLDTKLTAFEKE